MATRERKEHERSACMFMFSRPLRSLVVSEPSYSAAGSCQSLAEPVLDMASERYMGSHPRPPLLRQNVLGTAMPCRRGGAERSEAGVRSMAMVKHKEPR